ARPGHQAEPARGLVGQLRGPGVDDARAVLGRLLESHARGEAALRPGGHQDSVPAARAPSERRAGRSRRPDRESGSCSASVLSVAGPGAVRRQGALDFDPDRIIPRMAMPRNAQKNSTTPTAAPYSQWAMREDWVLNSLSATGGTAFRNRWKNHSPRMTPATR